MQRAEMTQALASWISAKCICALQMRETQNFAWQRQYVNYIIFYYACPVFSYKCAYRLSLGSIFWFFYRKRYQSLKPVRERGPFLRCSLDVKRKKINSCPYACVQSFGGYVNECHCRLVDYYKLLIKYESKHCRKLNKMHQKMWFKCKNN